MSANADSVRLKLCTMSLIGLVLKNYLFPEKHNFYIKLPLVLGRTFSCIKFLVVSDFKVIFK